MTKQESDERYSLEKDADNPNYRIPKIEELKIGVEYEMGNHNKLRDPLPGDRFGENYGYYWQKGIMKKDVESQPVRDLYSILIKHGQIRIKK